MAHDRALSITLTPVQFILCLALGLWLGAVAIGATAWLAVQLWPQHMAPWVQAVQPPAAVAPAAQDAQQVMFERYEQNVQRQQARQNSEAAAANPRNLDNPKCQFWLQQDRTAPTASSQAHVLEFCN
ncbi:hypothetical protein SJI00_04995 [Pseudomonas sp. RP23018S]|uniref:hypothetical protein n=1 Tax=Pseudomonas sp. RP23018S TaxID=3096037 RepID=UPI002ACA8412|nr:hypothetical protein [Pseudomonas sp. RP23018S]MDZ5602138.1 hypothetical protein [Pseudomonas sp. RP23018S]